MKLRVVTHDRAGRGSTGRTLPARGTFPRASAGPAGKERTRGSGGGRGTDVLQPGDETLMHRLDGDRRPPEGR